MASYGKELNVQRGLAGNSYLSEEQELFALVR
jgi:hypothetical protein